jgi:predicted transposase/invertase (TIGR01784 family)
VRAVFADPRIDFVFRRIFGAEARKPLLTALLNDLLELKGPRRIRDVQHLSLEQHVTVPKSKLSIVDVKCTTASGRHFVVEMQVLPVEEFEKRAVYNASKAYVMQLRDADEYPRLCGVVGVTLCNFMLWPKKLKGHGYKMPMLSRWRMQEQKSGHKGLRQVQYAFLELPKYSAGKNPETLIDKWAYFFREAKNLEVIPPALSEGPFREALEIARMATFTKAEWVEYGRSKMAEQDQRGIISLARREGEHKGKIEGKIEGRAEEAARSVITVLRVRGIVVPDSARAHPGREGSGEPGALA